MDLRKWVYSCPLPILERLRKIRFLNKFYDNIFKLFLIEWTKTIKAGGDSTVETFSTKKRKLNYTIHNPNTVEGTANYLLKVLIEANESKVETVIKNSINLEHDQPEDITEHLA